MSSIALNKNNDDGGCFKIGAIIIIIILALSICTRMNGQTTIYGAFQPIDYGVGIRADVNRVYASVSYGNNGLYKQAFIQNHTKVTMGALIPLKDYHNNKYDISLGINYHSMVVTKKDEVWVNPKIYNPWSFELGITTKLRSIAFAVATDILRWEPCVFIGIPLKHKRY